MGIGDRIKAVRKEQGLSMRALARKADTSVAHLSKLEKGASSPTLDTLGRIAQALGMSLEEITRERGAIERRELPPSLLDFIGEFRSRYPELDDPDWQEALRNVRLRGRYPESSEDWLPIFIQMRQALRE